MPALTITTFALKIIILCFSMLLYIFGWILNSSLGTTNSISYDLNNTSLKPWADFGTGVSVVLLLLCFGGFYLTQSPVFGMLIFICIMSIALFASVIQVRNDTSLSDADKYKKVETITNFTLGISGIFVGYVVGTMVPI